MNLKETLGKNIKEKMTEKGISQKTLADKVGVHQTAVSFWIKGEKTPHFDTLYKVAEVLDTSVLELLDDGKSKSAVVEKMLKERPEIEPLLYEASKIPTGEIDFAIEMLKRLNASKNKG